MGNFNVDINVAELEAEMEKLKILESVLSQEYDFQHVKEVLAMLLRHFNISFDEYICQLQYCMSSSCSIEKEK